jgi:hypothetical protein
LSDDHDLRSAEHGIRRAHRASRDLTSPDTRPSEGPRL